MLQAVHLLQFQASSLYQSRKPRTFVPLHQSLDCLKTAPYFPLYVQFQSLSVGFQIIAWVEASPQPLTRWRSVGGSNCKGRVGGGGSPNLHNRSEAKGGKLGTPPTRRSFTPCGRVGAKPPSSLRWLAALRPLRSALGNDRPGAKGRTSAASPQEPWRHSPQAALKPHKRRKSLDT